MASQEISSSLVNLSATGSSENTTDSNVYLSFRFIESEIAEWIWKIVPPIIFSVGIIGNILSILVLSRKKMRSGTLVVYLISLAVTDTGALVTDLTRYSLIYFFDMDIRNFSDGSCKAHTFATYFLIQLSGWILVSMTTERAIAIRWPHSWQFTKTKAALTLSIVTTVLFGANAHFLYGMKTESTRGCIARSGVYNYFVSVPWNWLFMCIWALAPFALLVAGNAVIICEIKKSQRNIALFISTAAKQENKDKNQSKRVGIMLIVVSAMFIVSTLPECIYIILVNGYPGIWKGLHEQTIAQLVYNLSEVFRFLNNAANFYLYCLSGSKFRRELTQIMSCKNIEPGVKIVNAHSAATEGTGLVTHM